MKTSAVVLSASTLAAATMLIACAKFETRKELGIRDTKVTVECAPGVTNCQPTPFQLTITNVRAYSDFFGSDPINVNEISFTDGNMKFEAKLNLVAGSARETSKQIDQSFLYTISGICRDASCNDIILLINRMPINTSASFNTKSQLAARVLLGGTSPYISPKTNSNYANVTDALAAYNLELSAQF